MIFSEDFSAYLASARYSTLHCLQWPGPYQSLISCLTSPRHHQPTEPATPVDRASSPLQFQYGKQRPWRKALDVNVLAHHCIRVNGLDFRPILFFGPEGH
jgi:hypothetical protein